MADLEVRVKDPSISRVHAEVTLGRDGWVVRDLGSTNGTFVNGIRVGDEERRLNKRDLLQCGNIVMLVNLLEEPASESRTSPNRVTTQKSWEEAVDYLARQLQATVRSSWEKAVEFSSLETTRRKAQRITSYLG
jgi:pSer/pThr/pTyr-binding forkhead associated (FHA) protein